MLYYQMGEFTYQWEVCADRETEKATLFRCAKSRKTVWLPKSQVTADGELTQWAANKVSSAMRATAVMHWSDFLSRVEG